MKIRHFFCSLFVAFLIFPQMVKAVETAQARAFCLSLYFAHARESGGLYSLDFTTLNTGVNGELALDFFSPNYSHSSYLQVTDEIFGDYYDGWIELNIPPLTDANGNGFNDFFEVSQAASGSTSGTFSTVIWGSGTVQAFWSRDAGSAWGNCTLKFKPNQFQTYTFTHQFMVYEFTGPLTYQPGTTNVQGQVDLTQTGSPDRKMQGPVEFVKTTTNRFNDLILQAGVWTNSDLANLAFVNDLSTRDPAYPTNYSGYLDFQDWDLTTPDPDYLTWVLSIDDPNDADHDMIPDLSDDPQSPPLPRPPLLSLARSGTNFALTISGDGGHQHQVLEAGSLDATTWSTNQTLTLTNDPQVVLLPSTDSAARFFRVRAW